LKNYYEEYWNRPDTYADGDPLAATRSNLLWHSLANTTMNAESLLDVGCGEGDLVADALERGLAAEGMDISETAVERAKSLHPNAAFHVHAVEQRPWPISTKFDVVASFEVIEHLLRPEELVRGCSDALKAGGYLALTTPYHGPLKNIAISLTSFDKHFAVQGDHIRFFTDKSLRRILETNGFEVVSIDHFGRGYGLWAGVFVWSRKK